MVTTGVPCSRNVWSNAAAGCGSVCTDDAISVGPRDA